MEKISARVRVTTMRELDALVGEHLAHEIPEVYWEDAHAVFRFETESEAMEAIKKLKTQLNLPKVNWEAVKVTQIKSYRAYSSEIAIAWGVVEKITASPGRNNLRIRRDKGMWHAAFGDHDESAARGAAVAICVAGLRTEGIEVLFDPDRIH
jgi:hypothetical protein